MSDLKYNTSHMNFFCLMVVVLGSTKYTRHQLCCFVSTVKPATICNQQGVRDCGKSSGRSVTSPGSTNSADEYKCQRVFRPEWRFKPDFRTGLKTFVGRTNTRGLTTECSLDVPKFAGEWLECIMLLAPSLPNACREFLMRLFSLFKKKRSQE